MTPSTWNFGSNWSRLSENADFQSIFARSASAVTPREKSPINTDRKSTMRFPMSLRLTSYVAPKPPKWARKRKHMTYPIRVYEGRSINKLQNGIILLIIKK